MSVLLVTRAVLSALARRPLTWAGVLLMVLSWPALRTFLPLGLSTSALHHWTAAYEVAFVGGALAIVGATGPLARLEWILRPIGPVNKIVSSTAALTTAGALMGACALVPAHLFHTWQLAEFRPAESAAALALGWLHVAAVAAVVLRLPLDPLSRVALLLVGLGVVPGLLTGSAAPERLLLAVLDAGGTLRSSFDFPLSRAHWVMASVPILGWAAAAVALASPPAPSRPLHAVRDPR